LAQEKQIESEYNAVTQKITNTNNRLVAIEREKTNAQNSINTLEREIDQAEIDISN